MKSFSWIVFLAFLVLISCVFAGSVKESASDMSPTKRERVCYRTVRNLINECPIECKNVMFKQLPHIYAMKDPKTNALQYRCGIKPAQL